MNPEPREPDPPQRHWQPRFGIGGLFLIVLIVSVMAAAGSYLARTGGFSPSGQDKLSLVTFLFITLAAPALLVVVVAAAARLMRRR